MNLFQKLLDGVDLITAGFIGGLCALFLSTEVKTLKQKISLLLFGTFSSYYLAMPAAEYFHLKGDGWLSAMGFLLGMLGYAFFQALMRSLKSLDIMDLVKNAVSQAFDKITGRFGGGSKP